MKVPPLQIQLNCLGAEVAAVRSDALAEPILIGRDAAAAWRPPATDRTMGARAAVLRRKGGAPFLKAEPDQTFRVNGVETREHVLKAGDRVSIGDCELTVSVVRERRRYAPWHRLEELGGARKGVFFELRDATSLVGSAPEAALRLRDDTVSRRHATLTLRDDECWIRDESSRNGTRVNGQRLGGKDRLLMDGDILSFGPFDYRFLDRNVPHVRTNSARGFTILLLSLLVAAGVWYAFFRRTPQVSDYLVAAMQYAAAERFDDAERMMDEARRARGFDSFELVWQGRKKSLALWRATYEAWNEFKQEVLSERFHAACTQIGLLSLDQKAAWDWDNSTLDARLAEAREAAALTQLAADLWCARYDLELSDEQLDALAAARARHGVDRPDFCTDERPWMLSLKRGVAARAQRFDANEARYTLLTNELSRIAGGVNIIATFTNDVERTLQETTGRVRFFAHQLGDPIEKLLDDSQKIFSDADALRALDLAAYTGVPVRTTPDDCAISASLGECQRWCVDARRELDLASLELKAMLGRLRALGADGTNAPSALLALEDTNRVERAFRCELLSAARPPWPKRTEPVDDEYDRLFGYEFLCRYLVEGYYAYPNDVEMSEVMELTFKPAIRQVWEIYLELCRDLKVFEGPEFKRLQRGRIAEFRARLASWHERIRAVRDRLDAIADTDKGGHDRRASLARGVAIYLTTVEEISKEDWDDLRARIVWYRDNIAKHLDAVDPTQPAKAREIARWVMQNGIPGSAPVKKAWNFLK